VGELDNEASAGNTITNTTDSLPGEPANTATLFHPAQGPAKEPSTDQNDHPAKQAWSERAGSTASPSPRQKRRKAAAKPSRRGPTARKSLAPPEKPAVVEGPEPPIKGATASDSVDPSFEGVFDIERLLDKQWSGKILWLKIKWKGLATGTWEKADHIKEDLGEEGYQELLETKPRKKRNKASKW
jgi:hypothetical protein